MPRTARNTPGGFVYHVLNRAVASLPLFEKEADYEAFERVLEQAQERNPTRILAYCVMPTHWHFVLWPRKDGEITAFLRWLTHTHTMRWHANHDTSGTGHLYQGRFKSFPVEEDDHFYAVVRYVERNAVRANLIRRAEQWRWSSMWRRRFGDSGQRSLLSVWPLPKPRDWLRQVNRAQSAAEEEALGQAIKRSSPLGSERWIKNTAVRLGLQYTLRPRGRPRKT